MRWTLLSMASPVGIRALAGLIASDNLLWRCASWVASYASCVTGDLRRDFRHLTGHLPGYFAERPRRPDEPHHSDPECLFAVENMFVWNVLPPCVATIAATRS